MDLTEIAAAEQEWVGRVQVSQPDIYFGWQPADPVLFSQLLQACLPHAGPFLEVGCGIGTKCLIAVDAGLEVSGFDRVPEYAAEATRCGVMATVGLAEDYTGYGEAGIVYVNHPLNCSGECTDEAVLEHSIHEAMAPGAVLISVNYDLAPDCRVHPPSQPCTDACPVGSSAWREVGRAGAWNAVWVKP